MTDTHTHTHKWHIPPQMSLISFTWNLYLFFLKKKQSLQNRLSSFIVKPHAGIDICGKSVLFSISRAQSMHHLGTIFNFDQVTCQLWFAGWFVLSIHCRVLLLIWKKTIKFLFPGKVGFKWNILGFCFMKGLEVLFWLLSYPLSVKKWLFPVS